MSVFAEVTMLSHGHGGAGWELGKCLWSPAATSSGQDRYSIMRQPTAGATVFHWVAGVEASNPRRRFLWGRSRVARPFVKTTQEPPSPGEWAGRPAYYRIELAAFEPLTPPLRMDEIEEGFFDLILSEVLGGRPKHFPYVPYQDHFRIAQGIYLTRLSPRLAEAFHDLFEGASGELASRAELEIGASSYARAFDEGERYRREVNFIRRHPALRKAAILKHGCACAVCNFDFEAAYGPLGAGFIEIHHLRSLAERVDLAAGKIVQTTPDDVIPLCSNCHRMAHRERPAIPLERLRPLWAEHHGDTRHVRQ